MALHAGMALVLMVGFYLLAIGLAGALVGLIYLDATNTEQGVHPKLILICAIGAGMILWSVVPRPDRFAPPGPRLDRQQQPRLFAEIDRIARAARQESPAEVYLVGDINAWVMERGGVLGLGSRRVMGLGLPLMHVLTQSEFSAVLAHEFGHFHGGDTRLGPWIHKTRAAIERTVQSLGTQGSLLQLPFLWYGRIFLRVTHAISRRQEFIADALAAQLAGAHALASGLRQVHRVGAAYQAYWQSECLPVLQSGFRPPLADGFRSFLAAPSVQGATAAELDDAMMEDRANPYDTHPPLKQRLDALRMPESCQSAAAEPLASEWLEQMPVLETGLLATLADSETAHRLQPIRWSDVGTQVYRPQWKRLAQANAALLAEVSATRLPDLARNPQPFAARCVTSDGQPAGADDATALAAWVIGAALTLLLLRQGATLNAAPGENVSVQLADRRLEPFSVFPQLVDGKRVASVWLAEADAWGIRDLPLGVPDAESGN